MINCTHENEKPKPQDKGNFYDRRGNGLGSLAAFVFLMYFQLE